MRKCGPGWKRPAPQLASSLGAHEGRRLQALGFSLWNAMVEGAEKSGNTRHTGPPGEVGGVCGAILGPWVGGILGPLNGAASGPPVPPAPAPVLLWLGLLPCLGLRPCWTSPACSLCGGPPFTRVRGCHSGCVWKARSPVQRQEPAHLLLLGGQHWLAVLSLGHTGPLLVGQSLHGKPVAT